jgi:poly(3-hydroxybutyrate) depolymerase
MADKLDNLIPFEKGESGNPNGRPKGSKNRSTIARRWMEVNQSLKNPLTSETETNESRRFNDFSFNKESKGR